MPLMHEYVLGKHRSNLNLYFDHNNVLYIVCNQDESSHNRPKELFTTPANPQNFVNYQKIF